jgi:hypothetical protein
VLDDVMCDVSKSLKVVYIKAVCNVLRQNLKRVDPGEASSIKNLLF